MAAKRAAGRTPCNPWDMRFPLCVGRMWDGTMFSSVCALPSPASAEGMLPFVVRLVHWYYDTVRLLLYPVLVHVVSQRARVLRLRRTEQSTRNSVVAVLPSSTRNGVGVLFHRLFEA